MSITYRDADASDATALAELFREIFCETFAHLYRPFDLAAFLAEQGAPQWAEQLRDERYAVRVAEDEGLVGLAKIGPVKLPIDAASPALELRQLYVSGRVRGSGVAAELMHWTIDEARARGAEELYLSVYTDNARARRFYAGHGFVDVGPCVFMVGTQADKDIIMRRSLD